MNHWFPSSYFFLSKHKIHIHERKRVTTKAPIIIPTIALQIRYPKFLLDPRQKPSSPPIKAPTPEPMPKYVP